MCQALFLELYAYLCNPKGKNYHNFHFTDEETKEVQRK